MDIEFHYWITGLIAQRAGFTDEEAKTIAYASQNVDDNNVCRKIFDRANPDEEPYQNFISQTMNILKPKHELMRIYPIFHFVPGQPEAESACRKDGKMHILNTTPDNPNANAMLEAAFNANDRTRLYRIGIATHAFVDSWAHQNFVGWYDDFNNIGLDLKPDIGHADGEHHPDWVGHVWEDSRLVHSVVSNKDRFTAAAKALFVKYCKYLSEEGREDKHALWPDLEQELTELQGPEYSGSKVRNSEKRLKRYRELLPGWDGFDESLWFSEAIHVERRSLIDSDNDLLSMFNIFEGLYYWKEDVDKKDTDWHKFQSAVKAHERVGIELLEPLLERMGYDLPPREQ